APLSRRNDAPEKAARPFDRRRDGVVLAEGAGVVVAEDLDHARRRGARVYAEVVGFGASFDRRRDGRGLARAARAAPDQAGGAADAVDRVNAHGLGTPEADRAEAQGLREVFGDRPVPVFAAKSYFGNVGAGSGLVELGLSMLASRHGTLPPTLNYEEPDAACPIAVTR